MSDSKTSKQIKDDVLRWYTLSVVSWQEGVVINNLHETIKKNKMLEDIVEVYIPEMIEVYYNKKHEKKKKIKKLYPWYVFVKSRMNEKIWYILRNTPWVRLIIWSEIYPTAISEEEMDQIKQKVAENKAESESEIPFKIWDNVIVKDEMEWVDWIVVSIDVEKKMLDVEADFMWRKTTLHVDVAKLEKKENNDTL